MRLPFSRIQNWCWILCLLLLRADYHAVDGKWEPEIRAFEAQDRPNPPAPGGVLFIGSSSIRLWKSLEQDFLDIE